VRNRADYKAESLSRKAASRQLKKAEEFKGGRKESDMMNFKQEELTHDFFQTVRESFPEVELTDITPSPEDPNDLWINVTAPSDEEREFSLTDMVSGRSADILLEYGYLILIIPTRSHTVPA